MYSGYLRPDMDSWLMGAAGIGLAFGLVAGVSYIVTGTKWLTWSVNASDSGKVA